MNNVKIKLNKKSFKTSYFHVISFLFKKYIKVCNKKSSSLKASNDYKKMFVSKLLITAK